jgi:mannonate dehydratase
MYQNVGSAPNFEEAPMRIGIGAFSQPTDERLRFFRQLGVRDVQPNMYRKPYKGRNDIPLTGNQEWSFTQLTQFRNYFEDAGLRLSAIECIPHSFYYKIIFGLDGRDKQLYHIKNTIRNIGAANIPVLTYHWMPVGVWRTSSKETRGGAKVDSFDEEELDNIDSPYMADEAWATLVPEREYTEEEFWENYEHFLKEILPVAEEAGVTLSLHPNDPPVERIGGFPSLFSNFENIKRAMKSVPSENHGLAFCLGCWAEMGADLEEAIRYFGERDELIYVHFRNVEGVVPSFTETFIDNGGFDPYKLMKTLNDVNFSGVITSDHVPEMIGDEPPIRHRSRAYTVGYLRAALDAIEKRE